MKKYKVVFCGTPEIGATILKRLLTMTNVEVKLVISQPDRFIGRKKVLTPTPVKEVAIEHKLTIVQPEKIITEYETILASSPDFIITCAYGQFIPSKILAIPTIDAINIHGSLLPKYRGGAPIQYAIKNGDQITGISIMKMVKAMDAGDYFVQEALLIDPSDNTGTLFAKMAILGANMIEEHLENIANKKLLPIKQDENLVSFSYNIKSEEEQIDWSKSAFEIHNLIRSLTPSPIAHTFMNLQRYKIKTTKIINDNSEKHLPGQIVELTDEGIIVQTGHNQILILELQRPGKTMMMASIYKQTNLSDLIPGMIFDEIQ